MIEIVEGWPHAADDIAQAACAPEAYETRSVGHGIRVVPSRDHSRTLTVTRNVPASASHPTLTVDAHVRSSARSLASNGVEKEPPRVLGGRYVVIALLGRGAMGSVYRAYDKSLAREVAVKVLQTSRRDAQAGLIEEAQAMAKLSHPHIVTVYDVQATEDDGRVVMAMEYIHGTTLQQWLQSDRTIEAILDVFRQAGQGLLAAHRAGIIHRDFKPSNVLVTEDGRAVVTDFGIARHVGVAEVQGTPLTLSQTRVLGTPWYMAPEQHLGLPIDPRVDQYALCVSLWEALAKKAIFSGVMDTAALIARKHEPLPPWPDRDAVPPSIVRAIYRGLSLRPEERFPTMAELLSALVVAVRGRRQVQVVAALSATTIIAAFGWSWQLERAHQCAGADEHLAAVWNDDRREAVEASLLATGLVYAPASWDGVRERLDRYTSEWAQEYRSTCEAAASREQTPAMMDLRMACLHRALGALDASVDVLERADAQVVERSVMLAAALPMLSQCRDVDALAAPTPPPDNAADASKVAAARDLLAQAAALQRVGKADEALARVEEADRTLAAVVYRPIEAELALRRGLALTLASRLDEAAVTLEDAMLLALEHDGDARAAEAATALTATLVSLAAHSEAVRLGDIAGQLAASVGNVEIEARARSLQSQALSQMGDHVHSERLARQALTMLERTYGAQHASLAAAHASLGSVLWKRGRHDDALAELRTALAIREATVGPEHPAAATVRNDIGGTLTDAGRPAEAELELRKALLMHEQALGPASVITGMTHNNLGSALWHQRRSAEALAHYRAAAAAFERTVGDTHPAMSDLINNIGTVLLQQKRYADAEREFRRAIEIRRRDFHGAKEDLAISVANLAFCLYRQGRDKEARGRFEEALVIGRAIAEDRSDKRYWKFVLAELLVESGSPIEARALLEDAWAVADTERSSLQADIAFSLAQLLWRSPADRARALTLAQWSSRVFAITGPTPRRRAVEAWLALRLKRSAR